MGLFDAPSNSQAQNSGASASGQKGPIDLAALYGSSPSPTPSANTAAMGSIALPSTPTPGTIGGGGGSLWNSGALTGGSGLSSKSQSPVPQGAGWAWGQAQGQIHTQPAAAPFGNGNGVGSLLGGQSTSPPAALPAPASSTGSGNQAGKAKDPFADLAGLF